MNDDSTQSIQQDIADIRGPIEIVDMTVWYIVAALMLLAIIATAVFIWWSSTRKPPEAEKPVKPAVPPYALAMRELDDARMRMSGHDDEGFTAAVTAAVRNYLEGAFALPAPKLTSEEFFEMIQQQAKLPHNLLANLQPFLEQCDLVKFAGQHLDTESRESLLQTAETFIEKAHEIEQGASHRKQSAPTLNQTHG